MYELRLPEDVGTLRPKEVAIIVAEQLAATLPGSPWKATANGLRQDEAGQVTEIGLQRSRYSRTGVGVAMIPRLTVRSEELKQWRGKGSDDRLFTSLLINISSVSQVDVPTGDALLTADGISGGVPYEVFVSEMLDTVMPNRALMRSPATLLTLPDQWLWDVNGLVEWSAAVGHPEICWSLVERNIGNAQQRRMHFMRGFEDRRADRPIDRGNSAAMLGFAIAKIEESIDLGPRPSWASGISPAE